MMEKIIQRKIEDRYVKAKVYRTHEEKEKKVKGEMENRKQDKERQTQDT